MYCRAIISLPHLVTSIPPSLFPPSPSLPSHHPSHPPSHSPHTIPPTIPPTLPLTPLTPLTPSLPPSLPPSLSLPSHHPSHPPSHSLPQDIVVFTNDATRCPYYKAESQNVKSRFACVLPPGFLMSSTIRKNRAIIPNTQEMCEVSFTKPLATNM